MSDFPSSPISPAPPIEPPAPLLVRLPSAPPLVTVSLLVVCILVYLGQLAGGPLFGYDMLAALGAKVNDAIVAGQWWRLVTPMFLHGSLAHIAFNMYALYVIGRPLETRYGNLRFLMLFLIGGVAGNVLSFAFSPNASLGSSTAIFGLLAAQAVFFYQNRQLLGGQASRALSQIGSIALINLIIGFTVPQIDNFGHIGGAMGGAAFAWFAGPLLRIEGNYPALTLGDQRDLRRAWLVALALGCLLTLVTLLLILIK